MDTSTTSPKGALTPEQSAELNAPPVEHCRAKIAECSQELIDLSRDGRSNTAEARQALHQMSYNLGILSVLTGRGRDIYDLSKPEVGYGILNGWATLKKDAEEGRI